MDLPLVIFVNTKSGGLQGSKIISKFKKCVPPENVFDLSQGGPLPGLQKYSGQRYRILVCGGDGSVGWVLTELDKLKLSRDLTPPVAILPIGTGNDLSRVLKWGGTHTGTKLKAFVHKIEKACVVHLDKWHLHHSGEGATPNSQHYMHNYFSIGADANIALQFHETRLAHPEKFSSRTQNLAWYVRLGLQNMAPEVLSNHVQVEINGKVAELPAQTRCVVVLNLPSYSGGGNPWGSKRSTRNKFANPAIDDGLLEVVAVNGPLQLVGIHANIIRGKRLGQGNLIKITTTKPMAAQVDGEPWMQPASMTTIRFSGKSRMLANSTPTAPSTTTATTTTSTTTTTTTATTTTTTTSKSYSKLHSNPSSPNLKVSNETDQTILRTMSHSHSLLRARSTSNPTVHTPSPIQYGPVHVTKRKKGRFYCEACGLEFYLSYMLANHHNSGLCSHGGSSSVKMPGTPPPTMSIQIGDGVSSPDVTSSHDVSDDEGMYPISPEAKKSNQEQTTEQEEIKDDQKQEQKSNQDNTTHLENDDVEMQPTQPETSNENKPWEVARLTRGRKNKDPVPVSHQGANNQSLYIIPAEVPLPDSVPTTPTSQSESSAPISPRSWQKVQM